MFADGIRPIGDGLLDVAEERLQALLVPQDINEVYDVEQTPFARGKFAAVRRAVHKSSGINFAAKFLRRRRRAQSSDKEIRHEIAVLMLCSGSENIVKLNAVHESRSDTALLLELATGGELQAILDDEGSLTEAQARFCMRQVLKALQFLHKKSIAHLDLKPQNILLAGKRVEDGLKLCDFGISRVIESGSKIREILGTPDYVAPEVLQYEPLSLQTDIWSVGVLAYVLLSGCSPFGGDTKQETFLNISQCSLTFPDDLFKDISQGAIDFIKSTLRIKAEDRLSAYECLEHIWLKEDSPLSSTFLTVSTADRHNSIDLEEDCDTDLLKCIEHNNEQFKMAATINGSMNGDRHRSDIGLESHQQKHSTSNGRLSRGNNDDSNDDENNDDDDDASNDHDKENFLANSPLATNNTKISCSLYSLQKYGNSHDKLNAQSKLHSPVSGGKHSTTNGKYLNAENRCSPVSVSHKTPIVNGLSELEYARNCLDKIRNPILPISPVATVTTATICLFPDAPTTPKVIRKTPTETTRSVKALVKKFQLETTDIETSTTPSPAAVSTTNPSEKTHIDDDYRVIDSTNHNGCGNGSSPNSNSNFKSTCVFCLTCGGPGCRHSGRTAVTKSSGNLGIDQGIIC